MSIQAVAFQWPDDGENKGFEIMSSINLLRII